MINHRLVAGALLTATALTVATPAAAQRIDRIVAFGDSYPDTGIARQVILADPAASPAFKGLVAATYPTGRFSGGTNYIDTLSSILSAPVENFAVGGAAARSFQLRTGPTTFVTSSNTNCASSPATCPLGLAYEVDQFLNVGPQSTVFPTGATSFGDGDLVAVSAGGNDARYYQTLGGTLAAATAEAAVSVAGATAQLNRLVAAGAQNISFLAGDTSRLPEVATDPTVQAIRATYSTTFNTGIQGTLAGYAANGVIVHYLDLTVIGNQITANPAAFGLTSAGACNLGSGCVSNPAAANQFLFYADGLHLTSAGFAIVARYIQAQLNAPLQLQAAGDVTIDTARQFGRTLTTRMDLGAPRDGDMPEGLGIYLVGDTFSRTLDATDRNDQFKITTVGLTGGVEYGFGSGMIGAALNVSRPKANFANDKYRDHAKAVQGGIYGGFGIAGGFVQGYGAIGTIRHDLVRDGVVSQLEADPKGKHMTAGIKAGYLMPFGTVRVGPVVALDHARARVDGYTEEGDAALRLNVGRQRFSSLRGSLGAELRGDFGGGGVQLRPYAAAVVEKDFTGDDRTIVFAQTSAPGIVNRYRVEDVSQKAYGRLSVGLSAAILAGISLNANVSGTVRKDQGNETAGHVGLRAAF